jgi:hypothetical protein
MAGTARADVLTVDQQFDPQPATGWVFCVTSSTTLGQQFTPTRDNVARVTVKLQGLEAGTFPVEMRILDASGEALRALQTHLDVAEFGALDPTTFDLEPPLPVEPGALYAIQLSWPHTEGALGRSPLGWRHWQDGVNDLYPRGTALSFCLGPPIAEPTMDFLFATYARVPEATFEAAREVVVATSAEPADGQMTGPNAQANAGRKVAFTNMLDSAEAMFAAGDMEGGCSQLQSVRGKITGQNAWFTGDTATALLAIVDALAAEHGCS